MTAELNDLLASARSEDRQNFYTILARSSLIGGNQKLTDFATMYAVREVKNPSQLLSARLYRAAFDIAGDNHAAAAVELNSLMRVPLQASDREILTAAISIAQELRRWPYGGNSVLDESNSPMPEISTTTDPSSASLMSVSSAQKLLEVTKPMMGANP
jgi:hypothetical protein